MIPRELWFERSFDFSLPISRFPSLLERLRGTPARIEERVHGLPGRVLTRRSGDQWSAQENIGHLVDLEPLWQRRAQQLFAGEPELAPTDLTNRRTHEANHNARSSADLCAEFRRLRAAFVQLLGTADAATLERTALHPRLRTPMRLIDLVVFVADHDDHHLAAIAQLAAMARRDVSSSRSARRTAVSHGLSGTLDADKEVGMARKKASPVAKASKKASAKKSPTARPRTAGVSGKRTTVKDAHDKYANQ